jgi:hypothetical protein
MAATVVSPQTLLPTSAAIRSAASLYLARPSARTAAQHAQSAGRGFPDARIPITQQGTDQGLGGRCVPQRPERLRGLESPQKLNWKVSIVDLLKLLGLDSSFAARKELALELGCPPEKMGDSAQMNMWLHKTVLQKIADNGGNILQELLD